MAKRDTSEQARRFGPMTGLLLAAAIAFIVLPSTLTLPNPSPTSQEEIAPVPPTLSKVNPQVSNFTSLASGSTGNGLGDGGGGGNQPNTALPPIGLPAGLGQTPPSTYQCVAGRQTEDPLSPTCVPFYIGANGGSTYQGVTAKEVKVVIYHDPVSTLQTSQGTSTPPYNTIVDVDAPPKPNEHPDIETTRGWEKFFFHRYAAYNRHVHLFIQFGSSESGTGGTESAGTQTADAARAYNEIHPFAVVNYAAFGNGVYYNNYMAEHGVLNFGSVAGRSAAFYKQFAGKQWGYPPPLEYGAAQYANFVCSSLANKPATDMGPGQAGANGPRKYGYLYTTDKAFPGIREQEDLSIALIKKQCGIVPHHSEHYATNSFSVDVGTTPDEALNIALGFKGDGDTTILWPAGYEAKITGGMNQANYYPEIVVGDDDQQANLGGAQYQDQTVWQHAWIVTSQTYYPPADKRICVTEYRTVDQTAPRSDVVNFACADYNDFRQLYTGIQVAGPTLTPTSLDQGFHAIPIIVSTDPQVPTCYYLAGDYTCVKDDAIEHWSSTARSTASSQPGCWLMVARGRRYLPGKFPTANLDAMKNPADPCNEFAQSSNLRI